jgi:acyl-CoA synthetase (AMP-forming)/AMP-acid ligase II
MSTMASLARRIAEIIQAGPSKPFFRFLGRGEAETALLTFGDVDDRARRVAAALLDRGLGGERLLLMFEPGPAFVEALVGCLYAGTVGIPVPAPRPGTSLTRLQAIAASSGASAILTEGTSTFDLPGERRGEAPVTMLALGELDLTRAAVTCPGFDLDPASPLLVQYTSGSTLEPRGVVLNSACIVENTGSITRGVKLAPPGGAETFVNWMPHYHDMALIGTILLPLLGGFETVQMPSLAFVQQPARWLQAISRYRGTISGGPPLAFDQCVARVSDDMIESLDLSCWRTAFCGAEPVFASTLEAFRDRFGRAGLRRRAVVSVYGLAEISVYAAGSHPPFEPSPATPEPLERAPCFCTPEALDALRIVSAEGHVLSQGTEGEIWLSSPSVADGYLDEPEATKHTFRNRLNPEDGRLYLRTGDLGVLRGDVLRVTGRIKDVVIRNGVNIAASDIERVATEGCAELNRNAAAACQTDGVGTPILLLIERERGPWDPEREPELIRAVRKALMDGLGIAVDHVALLEPGTLPRTTSGKIQRAQARAAWVGEERHAKQNRAEEFDAVPPS